jgi:plastocyanin
MRKTLTATALILGLVAAGCASDGSSSGAGGYGGGGSPTSGNPSTPTASSTESEGGRYGYGDGGSGSGSGGAGPVVGSVVVANYSFTPTNIQVKSGATIKIQNSTPSTPHTFTVTGEDIDVSLDPQSTTKVAIGLSPGTYPFICRFHEGSGMTGTLIVR